MALFVRSDRQENELKWAHIWFKQLAVFHKRRVEPSWKFTANDVIAFSRHKRDNGMPGWKRQRMVDGLMGHSDVATTMIYTHVVNRNDVQVVSPLDRLTEKTRSQDEEDSKAVAVEASTIEEQQADAKGQEADQSGQIGLREANSGEVYPQLTA